MKLLIRGAGLLFLFFFACIRLLLVYSSCLFQALLIYLRYLPIKKNVSYNKNNLCLKFDDPNWNQFED